MSRVVAAAAPAVPDRSAIAATRRRLTRSSRAARAHLVACVVLGVVELALIVAQATLLARVISAAFLGGADLAAVRPELIWLLVLALARGVVAAGFEIAGRVGAARVMAGLRGQLVEHLLLVRPGATAGERRGELAAAAVQGVDALEAYFARYLPQVALAALAPPIILAWTFPRDAAAAFVLAVTFPLIPVFMVLIGKRAEKRTRERWGTLAQLSAHFLDVVRGLATLRAHGRADAQVDTIARAGDGYRRATMGTLRVGFLSALVLELLAMIGTALVAATVGVQLASGDLRLEAGLTVLLLAPELYLPLRNAGAQFHASADGMAAAERIHAIIDTPSAIAVPEHPRRCPDPGAEPVQLREVAFAYAGRPEPVLRDVSLRIEPGETVALVGPSGAGKTTLAALLLRLADPGAGGVLCGTTDLRAVDPREWRRRVAWLPQRPTIFSGSVADNVRLGAPRATDEQVLAALAAANARAFVDVLPDGIETPVGEDGRGLSAGEAQRIALARAFLGDSPLVILDEPTAHLDAGSERAVAEAVARLAEGRTALLIVHRPELAGVAGRVLELRDGRVVEARGGSEVPG
jgi:ATP-binding cassette, subfamily C, bacterial CydD